VLIILIALAVVPASRSAFLRCCLFLVISEDKLIKADVVTFSHQSRGQTTGLNQLAQWVKHGKVNHIVLIGRPPTRTDRCQASVPFEQLGRDQLIRLGVPPNRIDTITSTGRDRATEIAALGQHLQQNTASKVIVLTDRISTRLYRQICSSTLDAEIASRISVVGLPEQMFDLQNWWHSRVGMRNVVIAILELLHAYAHGGQTVPGETWDAEQYEKDLCEWTAETMTADDG